MSPRSSAPRNIGRVIGGAELHITPEVSLASSGADELPRCTPERLAADGDLVDRLMLDGYRGPRWENFRRGAVEYALPILTAWVVSGEIASKCAQRGRPLRLIRPAQVNGAAEDLAVETVAIALDGFQHDVLVPGKWDRTRGASLHTYFVGRCILVFPNVYRDWRRAYVRSSPVQRAEPLQADLTDRGVWSDPERITLVRATLKRTIEELEETTGEVVLLDAAGYEDQEIAARVGLTRKAVELRLYRFNKK